jgi:predicted phosphodiesterase
MKNRCLTILAIVAGLLVTHCSRRELRSRVSAPPSVNLPPAVATYQNPLKLTLPPERDSVRFAVIGDMGTGGPFQYEVAREMADYHGRFPFNFVIMLGDNIYGRKKPPDFERKFDLPYKPLIDAGVDFYASLGNHDNTNERYYKLFNMNGRRYYTFKKGDVRFFALDSNYMDPQQLKWLEVQLRNSNEHWKICFFHHPLYSDGRSHGPDLDLRARLEPLLEKYNVNVVFSGHEHVYERIKPQHGLYYFIVGNSGELRRHNLRPSSEMAVGFDSDRAFMMVEIAENNLYFETVSRSGGVVDSGTLLRLEPSAEMNVGRVPRRHESPF